MLKGMDISKEDSDFEKKCFVNSENKLQILI